MFLSQLTTPNLLSARTERRVAKKIEDRLSQELVIALVGPVGSGVTTAGEYIRQILEVDFSYDVAPTIKPSDIIREEAHRVGFNPPDKSPLHTYILEMQNGGNALRERFGNDYLAEKTVERIYKYRTGKEGMSETGIHLNGRQAYIIDSLKSHEELDLLRKIYGETLCVFGIFAPDAMRQTRLKDGGVSESQVDTIMDRDSGEVLTFGQKTRKLFVGADFFICNDHKKEELKEKLTRYINLIFCTSIHTPTKSESAMYEAASSSANSACMSRQVGAAIVSDSGELVSVGWNDVPRFGGGLYSEDDRSTLDTSKRAIIDSDNRCFKWGGCICHNETRRDGIIAKIAKRLNEADFLKRGKTSADVISLLKGTEIDSLIEFSRSIHAEMEAILSVAREGRRSLVGATLYTNTYPCHNCARHIVAAGISNVYYIEPYEKSLATALHHDAITEDPDDSTKVRFRQYDGVAPKRYLRLFRSGTERKSQGQVVKPSRKHAVPLFRIPLDAPALYEAKVIADLSGKEQTPSPEM